MRNSRQAVPKRADFATTRRCRKRQTNQMHKDRADISPALFCGRMQLSCAVGAAFTAARRVRCGDTYERSSALSSVG